jgi:UDP-N-acetylglucosamine 2-epimerase (non-hydrolysing)
MTIPSPSSSAPIDIIAGARPNFMKIAPVIRAIQARQAAGSPLRYRLVHTGQHYDRSMSGDFFSQLGIPEPDVNLEVGSGSQAQQTAAIMTRYETLLMEAPSALCLVVGDVTSTMACAIVAQKLCIPVAHVEGGIRSGDWTMPEEINRLATDAITNWFFTTSEVANANLRRSGVGEERIFFVGNTMIDTLLANLDRLRPPAFWADHALQPGGYFVATLHRPANVDTPQALQRLLGAIDAGARGLPVVFPVHPRTRKTLSALGPVPSTFVLVESRMHWPRPSNGCLPGSGRRAAYPNCGTVEPASGSPRSSSACPCRADDGPRPAGPAVAHGSAPEDAADHRTRGVQAAPTGSGSAAGTADTTHARALGAAGTPRAQPDRAFALSFPQRRR